MSATKKGKRTAAFLLTLALFVSGCAGADTAEKPVPEDKQLGRYVEEFWEIQDLGRCGSFTRLADGSLAVFSFNYGPFRSTDEGKTWEKWQNEWYDQNKTTANFQCAAFAPDGSLFAGYFNYGETAEEETEGEQEEDSGSAFDFTMSYQMVDVNGQARSLEIEEMNGKNDRQRIVDCWFAPDGTLYAADYDSLYEVSVADGSLTRILEGKWRPEQVCFSGNDLLAVTIGGVLIYDRETNELKESDPVLDDFVKDKAGTGGNTIRYTSDNYNVYLACSSDDMLYLVCDEGIYAHKIGGGTVEKLLEGSLCTMGDPDQYIFGMLPLADDAFLVLYRKGMGKIAYDPDMPSVPEKELKVYSLNKDDVVQKAVSLFQQAHQDVYVNYEVGMKENSGQTAEDVIKALNTEILAGNGPDVLILDGFPIESYMEKGLLLDLTEVLLEGEGKEEIYDNVAGAFRKEGKVFALPMRCKLPLMIGPKDLLKEGEGLETLAACTDALRREKENGSVMGGVLPYATLRLLSLASAPSWEKEDGSMEEEKVEEFLRIAKQIYEQEKKGVSDEEIEDFGGSRFSDPVTKGILTVDTWLLAENAATQVFLDDNRMGMGLADSDWSLELLFSAKRQREGLMCGILSGQSENVFLPYTIAGISASAREKEMAEQFVGVMLSREAGSGSGFSVNRAVNEENLAVNGAGGGSYGAMVITGDDGTEAALDIYGLSEEELEWFDEVMQSLKTPYLPGGVLENAVLETGEKVLLGELDIPEAITEIQGKVKLSLAE